MKKQILLIVLTIGFISNLYIAKVYADENTSNINESNILDVDLSQISVNDTFEYNDSKYSISLVNSSDIYINNEQIDIYNFEAYIDNGENQTWRKYVKFNDLCSNSYICEDFSEDDTVALRRKYKKNINDTDIYYTTKYTNDTKTFESKLVIGEDNYTFNTFKDENSIFDSQGILTADVEPLIDSNNDLYVSLRFVTESLGAEVIWTEKESDEINDRVDINFYDDESYCKGIDISYEKSCENIDEEILNEIKSCDETDNECLSDRCKEYISENLNSLENSFKINTNYNYINVNDKLVEFEISIEKEKTYIDGNNLYIIIMYNGVPLPYNIFDDSENSECENIINEEKKECLKAGKKWITDEIYLKLRETDEPFCANDMENSISEVADK